MNKIEIPFKVKRVIVPTKSIPIYQKSNEIGKATIYISKGEYYAKTSLKEDCNFTCMGTLIIRDGDIIEEIHIEYLHIKE
jgi:hypothetical protein